MEYPIKPTAFDIPSLIFKRNFDILCLFFSHIISSENGKRQKLWLRIFISLFLLIWVLFCSCQSCFEEIPVQCKHFKVQTTIPANIHYVTLIKLRNSSISCRFKWRMLAGCAMPSLLLLLLGCFQDLRFTLGKEIEFWLMLQTMHHIICPFIGMKSLMEFHIKLV